jgi:peroxidase
VRANENVELSNITTLFVREHNYQAALLAKQHPTWTDEQLYQGARQIVIGEIQSITYNEWLPALMGNNALTPYHGYNPNVNPTISVEFASAAFRLHTLLSDDVEFLDNNGNAIASLPTLALSNDFFQPGIVALPGEVAANLKYLSTDLAQEVDEQTVDGLRNALFPDAPVINNVEVGASDLIAADIQRGRDQGDPTYNQLRIAMGERPVTSFAQITSNVQLQQQLKQAYGNVNNVEAFVGLMAEDHLRGSSLGQTEQAVLAKQFEALRDGDRFFYQNADPASLVQQLNNTTLSQIIQRNTTLTNLQSNVFLFYSNIQGTVVSVSTPTLSTNGVNRGGSPTPMAGVTVQLIENGAVVETTTTNARGVYQFQDTGAASYTVKVIPPAHGNYSSSSVTTRDVDITKGQAGPNSPAIANFTLLSGSPWWSTRPNAAMVSALMNWLSHLPGPNGPGGGGAANHATQTSDGSDTTSTDALPLAIASSLGRQTITPQAVDHVFTNLGVNSLKSH